LEELKNGKIDMMLSAFKTPKREKEFRFSIPVRQTSNVLYTHRNTLKNLNVKTIDDFLEYITTNNIKFGITKGYAYSNDKLNNFISNHANSKYILAAHDEVKNFINLKKEKVSFAFIDRLIGASLIYENSWENELAKYSKISLPPKDVFYIFNKKNITKSEVSKINIALQKLKNSGKYSHIVKHYLFPIMINQTINSWWYFYIIFIGIIAYSIYSLKLAIEEGYSFIGVLFFVTIFTLGGGIIRDIIMARYPMYFVLDPLFLYMIFITIAIGFLLINIYKKLLLTAQKAKFTLALSNAAQIFTNIFFKYIFVLIDALGLAVFTVFGVLAALDSEAQPLILWGPLLAVITVAGGGFICDIIRRRSVSSMTGNFYPEISAIWGFILSLLLNNMAEKINSEYIPYAVFFTVAGAFLMRITVYFLKIPTLTFVFSKIKNSRYK